ncbi:hypothetical protein B0675_39955 [Streptomyces sp. M41(2017)]|uniref:hypothetical protein n=1 Tax=Streptomyces sp. M41(2017) TaxID=1955065 RepID=UPI0009C0D20B|nr:hypothetical protein [Streptomyces sp. M41(2017)]OQQ12994.1 hypothetical protein B0675_39955 [Streptomyces sp. M41(2017)]
MTASPSIANGSTRPRAVQFADWRITQPDKEQSSPQPVETAEPAVDLVAAAEAAAIRARSEAEVEKARILAEAEAEAIRTKAAEEARKLALANNRNERKEAEEQAASEARIAEHNRRREDADRAREEAAQTAEKKKHAAEAGEAEQAKAEDKWSDYARGFYIVCAIVALPVQVAAFYDPNALWLMAAPLMLEGGAWVVLKGAAAAVAARRPHWHYRLIAWLLAFIAAAINLWHGLNAFDPATAIATAFASVAGPGVWDLHEHGRIRKRDGALTRRERRAKRKTERAEAARLAAEAKQRAADAKVAREAAEKARTELRETRQREFPEVWKEAVKIGAALGKEPDDSAVWPRAYRNIEGTDPGESITSISSRRAAEKRVEAALTGTPVSTLSKTTNAQRAIQTPRSGYKPNPPRRTKGDTPRYNRAAGRAHADLLRTRNARQKDAS